MNTRVKELGGYTAEKSAISDAELEILRGELFVGGEVSAADVHVRRMLLCHDQVDRTYERFPKQMLRRFADTLPGRSVLPGHDTGSYFSGGSLPLARFFDARLQSVSESAFPVLKSGAGTKAQQVPGDAPPPGFELSPTKVTWLKSSFYFPAHESTDALRAHLDTGVYKWVSIGFRYSTITCDICGKDYLRECPHLLGRYDEESGKTCTGTYSGDMEFCEALEGSIVYLGGQQRARAIKSMREAGGIDVDRLSATPYGEDLVARKELEDLAKQYGSSKRFYSVGDNPATRREENAPDGVTLADEARSVLAQAGQLVERATSARELRLAKGGRGLGADVRASIRSLRESLETLEQVSTTSSLSNRAKALAILSEAEALNLGIGL